MAGFKAETVVEKLEWDFRPFVADAHGVTPEPSDDKAFAFLEALRDLTNADSDEEAVGKLAGMSSEEMRAVEEKLVGATADLCSDCPTRDQITALPYRQRQAFFGYITGQVLNPR